MVQMVQHCRRLFNHIFPLPSTNSSGAGTHLFPRRCHFFEYDNAAIFAALGREHGPATLPQHISRHTKDQASKYRG